MILPLFCFGFVFNLQVNPKHLVQEHRLRYVWLRYWIMAVGYNCDKKENESRQKNHCNDVRKNNFKSSKLKSL